LAKRTFRSKPIGCCSHRRSLRVGRSWVPSRHHHSGCSIEVPGSPVRLAHGKSGNIEVAGMAYPGVWVAACTRTPVVAFVAGMACHRIWVAACTRTPMVAFAGCGSKVALLRKIGGAGRRNHHPRAVPLRAVRPEPSRQPVPMRALRTSWQSPSLFQDLGDGLIRCKVLGFCISRSCNTKTQPLLISDNATFLL
jgi:hypothetical protein